MVKTKAEWDAMDTADFRAYDAVLLPDDNCNNGVEDAANNAHAWVILPSCKTSAASRLDGNCVSKYCLGEILFTSRVVAGIL